MIRLPYNNNIRQLSLVHRGMKRYRSFEQNDIQNFEIQQQFSKIMQIQGLNPSSHPPHQLYPSLSSLFKSKSTTNIIGKGPNANIRAFYYLLLCHIRKVHLKQLLQQYQEKQIQRIDQEEGGRKDRRVSFSGKAGGVFLNGPLYQNYALHKLRIYAFGKETQLMTIRHSPFQWDPAFQPNNQPLTSLQLKKLLSQFLKLLLPSQFLPSDRSSLPSIKSLLNKNHTISLIFSLIMRHILYKNYEISSSCDFQQQINDHTVCTTLCDAFAIDGLKCGEGVYQINSWCKVWAVEGGGKGEKVYFVEMSGDQFQDFAIRNQEKNRIAESHKMKRTDTFNKNQQQNFLPLTIQQKPQMKASQMSVQQSYKSSEVSGSMMDNDEDSQKPSSSYEEAEPQRLAEMSEKRSTISKDQDQEVQEKEYLSMKEGDVQQRSTFNQSSKKEQDNISEHLDSIRKVSQEYQQTSNEAFKRKITPLQQPQGLQFISFSRPSQAFTRQSPKCPQNTSPRQQSWTHFPKVSLPKSQKQYTPSPGIINNNISNNIYLSLGDNQYRPVINISSDKKDPGNIKINLS